jgi:SAM-dependent methyltransferase
LDSEERRPNSSKVSIHFKIRVIINAHVYKREAFMSADKTVVQTIQEYRDARTDALASLFAGLELFGLIRGAASSGLFKLTRSSISAGQVSNLLRIDSQQALDLCHAFFAHGVFVKENEKFRLSDKWSILTDPDATFAIENVLDGVFARATALRLAIESGANFWSMNPLEREALAKSGSVNPFSPHSPKLYAEMIETNLPELHNRILNGGSYLELGCGVGGGFLSTVQAYPNIVALGVELSPDLLEVAKQRTLTLGLGERVSFWQGDAQNFTTEKEFDYVWWSQFFFPPATRAKVIKAAVQALRPSGFMIAPVMANPSLSDEQLQSAMGQAYMRNRVLFGSWGIPAVDIQELQQELEAGGFVNLRSFSTPLTPNPMIAAQKPPNSTQN